MEIVQPFGVRPCTADHLKRERGAVRVFRRVIDATCDSSLNQYANCRMLPQLDQKSQLRFDTFVTFIFEGQVLHIALWERVCHADTVFSFSFSTFPFIATSIYLCSLLIIVIPLNAWQLRRILRRICHYFITALYIYTVSWPMTVWMIIISCNHQLSSSFHHASLRFATVCYSLWVLVEFLTMNFSLSHSIPDGWTTTRSPSLRLQGFSRSSQTCGKCTNLLTSQSYFY